MHKIIISFFFIAISTGIFAQRSKVDSMSRLLTREKIDSNRVILLWNMAVSSYAYDPDTALILAQDAINLAKEIKYVEGESRATGVMANSFLKIGNYPKALEFYLQKLKIDEQRNIPRNLASVIMNIGIVHVYQEEYEIALPYYYKADSLIRVHKISDLEYNIAVNLGDIYNKIDRNDSAFYYFNKSLKIAYAQNNGNLMGSSLTGIGHSYAKQAKFEQSAEAYHEAMRLLQLANDEDIFCEAAIGMARVFEKNGPPDSAVFYANLTSEIAKKDGFLSWEYEATNFLTDHYRTKNSDSVLKYLQLSQVIRDTLSSKSRIRELQILSSNEQLRQSQIAQAAIKKEKERSQQLQLLFIGIFIPGLFLLTIYLSKKKVNVKVIRTMGVVSLLILFEYLTLLLHPQVLKLANYTPVYEIIIFVGIAAILIPSHHKLESWLISKLTKHHVPSTFERLKLKTMRLKTKKPSGEV